MNYLFQKIAPSRLAILTILLAGFVINGCETPSKPNFEVEQSFSVPLISNVNYIFLGETGAIIDTTNSDFENLFTVDPNDLVRLGVEVDFDIGSFDEAIPDPEVNPFEIESNISDLTPEIDGSGQTDFESLTNLPSSLFPAGTPIPGSTASDVPIPLDMGDFISAESAGGTLLLTFRNELGFDMQSLQFAFEANGNQVGTGVEINNFDHNSTRSAQITFSDGEFIETPLNVIVSVTWENQLMAAEPGELVVVDISNEDLNFRSAEAVFEPQEILKEFEAEIDNDEFSFSGPDDFVEIASASIQFENLKNTIDLEISELIISFPTVLTESSPGVYLPEDSLVVVLEGDTRIRRGSHPSNIDGITFDIPLTNFKVTAPDNIINIFVKGTTEDTSQSPPDDRTRTINEGDGITGTVQLVIDETTSASGLVQPRFISLNDSDTDDLDITDPDVRIQSDVSDLESITEKIQNLQLVNPELTLHLESNIGIETRVYAAIVGTNPEGEEMYLSGKPGTPFHVSPDEEIDGLVSNGVPISKSDLIAINVEASDIEGSMQAINFNSDNSNIQEFVGILPTEIFFVGKALVNPDSERGTVVTPVELSSSLSMDVPITLTSSEGQPTTFSDTIDATLDDLPGADDNTSIIEAIISVSYGNRIPLNINLNLDFLTEEEDIITSIPLSDGTPIQIFAAPVDAMGFSSDEENNVFLIELNEDQLNNLNKTEKILLTGELLTSDNDNVSVRSSDSVSLSIRATFKTRVKVD